MMNASGLALGLVEVPFLSLTALVADHATKSADVRLLGIESTGTQNLLMRLEGNVGAVTAALAAAETRAIELGATALTCVLPRPATGLAPIIHFANSVNPLYGGRDQFLPTDHLQALTPAMNPNENALGILETQGLAALLEATDTMLKAANVSLVGKEKIGAAYVTVIVRGDVAAVRAAIDAGAKAVDGLGKLIAAHVIARPHEDLLALLPR